MELFPNVESKFTDPRLGDRHKKINELVRETPPNAISVEMLRANMSKMKQVDLVFIGRLANHTKNPGIVCELLKSEDSMVVSVALQSKWFFTGSTAYKDMANVEYFDREIFPYTSYHAVCRIVSTFSASLHNEPLAEHFYNYLYQWYGKELAVKLLPKCTLSFIRSHIMESLSDIPPAQIYYIYKRDQTLALQYLDKYLRKEKAGKLPRDYVLKMNYDKIWKSIAVDNPNLFFNLFEKYQDNITARVGQKAVKEILEKNSDTVIENLVKYSKTIPKKHVINHLNEAALEKYLIKCLPAKEAQLLFYQNEFLNLKPKYRFKMLVKLYPLKYEGKRFVDREDFTQWNLTEYLSKQERIVWARKRLEYMDSNDVKKVEYFKYLDGEEAMRYAQDACSNKTEWLNNSEYINAMVESCKLNNDVDLLLRLMKYVYHERKNDHYILCHSFIETVKECFELLTLSSEHWEVIKQLINFPWSDRTKGCYYWDSIYSRVLRDYLRFCLSNGLEIDLIINNLVNADYNYGEVIVPLRKEGFEEKIVHLFLEKYPKIIEASKERRKSPIVHVLVQSFECEKQNIVKISDYPWLLEYFQKYYDTFCNSTKMELFEATKNDPKIRELFTNKTFKCVNAPFLGGPSSYSDIVTTIDKNVGFVKNLIMFNPEVIIDEINHFIHNTVTYKSKVFKFHKVYEKIQIYQRQPLGERLIKALKEDMNKEDIRNTQELAVYSLYLCYLLPFTKHNEILQQNNPYGQMNRKIFGKYIKTLNPPVSFDVLTPCFVNGIFLKSYLPSLLSLPFKKSRLESKQFIQKLLQSSCVPAKKHAVRLSYFLYCRKDLLPLYKSMWSTEKNSSIREVLFSFTYKLLRSEANTENYKEIWETLKCFIESLNENDLNILKHLTKPHEMMPGFVNEYCQICWKTLNDFKSKNIDVELHKNTFIKNASPCMELLDEEFKDHIERLVIPIPNEFEEIDEDFNLSCFNEFFSE